MKTKIYGASDDLIEIEGFTYDEIDCYEHKRPIKFECSDGTIGTIFYNGVWKLNIKFAGNKFIQVIESVGDENRHDEPNATIPSYSDILILDSGIEWVKIKGKVIKDMENEKELTLMPYGNNNGIVIYCKNCGSEFEETAEGYYPPIKYEIDKHNRECRRCLTELGTFS